MTRVVISSLARTFRGLCSLIESVKQRTTPYHPQCDGGAERLICTVTSVISKIAEKQKEWDQYLPKVLLALRASTHETTGFSPSMLMFGTKLRLPIDAMRGGPPSERPSDYPSFVKKQHEILRGVSERVGENLRVTGGMSTMHAARETPGRTERVIWYDWRKRLFPVGYTGSSIAPGPDHGE